MLKQALKLYTDLIGIGDMIEYQIYQTAISQTNTHRKTVEEDIAFKKLTCLTHIKVKRCCNTIEKIS